MATIEYHLNKPVIKRVKNRPAQLVRTILFIVYAYIVFNYTRYIFSTRGQKAESMIQTYFTYIQNTVVIPMVIVNLIYFALYYFNFSWLELYRLNDMPWPWESDPVEWRRSIWKVIRVYVVNQILIFPACFYLLTLFVQPNRSLETIPGFSTAIWQLVLSIFMEDFFFYWSHRLMHLPFLYKRVHKIHHEFKNTIHIASVYTHWFEFILGNFFPMMMPLIMLGERLHVTTLTTFILVRVISTYAGHSGFDFPWMPTFDIFAGGASFHNYHHLKNMGNYGSHSWVWDYLFKTNVGYYKEAGLEKSK